MRITGIGGTGVVTVTQVLATAAVLAGLQVRALDQTGLAQKGGAVVSDLQLSPEPCDRAGQAGRRGECDLLPRLRPAGGRRRGQPGRGRRRTAPSRSSRTVAGADRRRWSPTPAAAFPDAAETGRPRSTGRPAAGALGLDAPRAGQRAARRRPVRQHAPASAPPYQAGALPIAGRGDRARRSSSTASPSTRNMRGVPAGAGSCRRPGVPAAAMTADQAAEPVGAAGDAGPSDLAGAARSGARGRADRATRTRPTPRRYAALRRAWWPSAERGRPGAPAADRGRRRHLYKLMAYKDEYEVARLHLDPALDRDRRGAVRRRARGTPTGCTRRCCARWA